MKAILSVLVLTMATFATANAELTADEFNRLHRELKPSPDAAWRSIPWKTSVLDAQAAAAKQRKLIFIWAMDGHPLGCT